MDYLEMKLYLAIKHNDYTKVCDILRNYDLVGNEFFDDKVTFVSLAIINSNLFALVSCAAAAFALSFQSQHTIFFFFFFFFL